MATRPRLFRRPENGSVAVEMAVILPVFFMLLAVPLFFACIFWFYSVGQKAAHDAARYLSGVTQAEMRTIGSGFGDAKVKATAVWIAQQELEEILPFTDSIGIDVACTGSDVVANCGTGVPTTVSANIAINLHDTMFPSITGNALNKNYFVLSSNVTMRYVGN